MIGMAEPVIESIVIAAEPESVYDLVADVSRMGEWSPEATSARGASVSPAVGDRFVGWNKNGPFRWWTYCTVREADRGRVFAFDVDFGPFPVSHWRYEFETSSGGTLVRETWRDRREGKRGLAMRAVGQVFIPGNREQHNRVNMVATLQALKAAAERGAAG